MKSILTEITVTLLIILISLPEKNISRKSFTSDETGKNETGTLKDRNGAMMRGTPMVLSKNLKSSVDFATNIKNWEKIKENGFNTIRVCWVDGWQKDHGRDYWSVEEVLPYYDKCVENAHILGMNLIINYHNVGPQQNFDTTYTFQMEKEFWKAIAPRYKDNNLVYYELANEPTFRMSDYHKPGFKKSLMQIYRQVRNDAPEREILMFSFNTIQPEILDVVEHYENELDWNFTTIAYHMYNSTSSDAVKKLMEKHRVICTEWFYHFVSLERPEYTFIKQVDGHKENAQTLEMIGSSWIDWRDWDDTTLNELLDTLITDAKIKNYWWKK
ncbi:cellulase family glycosylhydrolase [Mariniphaga sp.]|uniref:cellulase family glycosylhydrolase n=1 Tax=Mariniphaga sp. TaxID=1954475 RepID=UPI003561ABEF